MKTIKIITLLLGIFMLGCDPQSHKTDIINETFPETQSEIKNLVDNIFKDGAAKNLEELDAYHLNSHVPWGRMYWFIFTWIAYCRI